MESSVYLRALRPTDIATYVDWGADRLFCLHAGWTVDLPRSAHEARWRRIIEDPVLVRLAAVRDDDVIGYVDLHGTELGYVVGPPSRWGQGLGGAIARLGLEHAFRVLGFDSIDAEAAETNHASLRILQSLGMSETDQHGEDTYLGVLAPTRCFRITRESYLRQDPVPEGK